MSEPRSWTWPLIIATLLVGHVGTVLFFVLLATSRPSVAIEKDYYEKALRWDERLAQERHNQELGWQIEIVVEPALRRDEPNEHDGAPMSEPPEGSGGLSRLLAYLMDAEGRPLGRAMVRVEAFHNARAARVLDASLLENERGCYAALLPMRRSGLWELRFTVESNGDRYTQTLRKHLVIDCRSRSNP
jgi:nitrogen fixation protein FixH